MTQLEQFDPRKMHYELRRNDSSGYKLLLMRVWGGDPDGFRTPRIDFTWQCNGNDQEWYAFHIELEVGSYEEWQLRKKLVTKIFSRWTYENRWGGINQVDSPTPAEMIQRIGRKGGKHIVYDGRLSRFVLHENLAGSEFQGWRDDWKHYKDASGCHAAVLAKNEEEAIRVMTPLIEAELKEGYFQEYLKAWLANPRVVCLNGSWNNTPDQRTIVRLLNDPVKI